MARRLKPTARRGYGYGGRSTSTGGFASHEEPPPPPPRKRRAGRRLNRRAAPLHEPRREQWRLILTITKKTTPDPASTGVFFIISRKITPLLRANQVNLQVLNRHESVTSCRLTLHISPDLPPAPPLHLTLARPARVQQAPCRLAALQQVALPAGPVRLTLHRSCTPVPATVTHRSALAEAALLLLLFDD